jgi:hypothetical protein
MRNVAVWNSNYLFCLLNRFTMILEFGEGLDFNCRIDGNLQMDGRRLIAFESFVNELLL